MMGDINKILETGHNGITDFSEQRKLNSKPQISKTYGLPTKQQALWCCGTPETLSIEGTDCL